MKNKRGSKVFGVMEGVYSRTYMIDKSLTKIIHYVVNVMSTEAELFAIRCGINQTLCFNNISNIIIITDFYQDRKK